MDPIFKINELIIDTLKRHMPRDVKITDIKFTEKEAAVKFKYDSDNYEYKISSAGIKRQTDKTFLDYVDLQAFEDFFEDLRSRLFSDSEPGQVSLFDYDKQHDEKVIHELSDEEAKELNKLVDNIQADDEKEFGEEVIDIEFEEKTKDEDIQKCRVCGCTWDNACPGGCSWVEFDLCSECFEKEQTDSNANSEILNASISNNDETLKDDPNIINSENVAENASNDKTVDISNLKIELPMDTPKHCEKCGQVAIELDVNNECAECAKEDIFEPGTIPSGFGQSITASF